MYGLNNYSLTQFSEYKNHLEDASIIVSTNTETEIIGTKTFNIAGRHAQNAKSSNIKIAIDAWYQDNILNTEYENMLEDTVWCNDRSTINIEDAIAGNVSAVTYSAYERVITHNEKPTLSCVRNVDKFTVNSLNGNGDLEYPIGLLTTDEVDMAYKDKNLGDRGF